MLIHIRHFCNVFIIIAVFVLLHPGAALCQNLSPETEAILSALEKKYSGKSFTVKYTQVSKLTALDIVEKATGRAFFSHPGKMRWEYETPENHQVITNGKTLWIHRPQENQVLVGDAEQFFKSGAGGAFLSDISLIRKNYDIQIKQSSDTFVELTLKNLEKNTQITSIEIRITRPNHEITRVVTLNPYDDETHFEFDDIKFLPLNPDYFNFIVPEGITVLEMK